VCSFAATHACVKRGTIAIVLILAVMGGRGSTAQDAAFGPAGAGALTIEVEIATPPGHPAARSVFPEESLRKELRRLAAPECDPHAIEDALARRYRFLGYVPALTVTCAGTSLRVQVRESSATVDLITFDPAELSRIGVKADPEFEEKLHLYPVPADAPRAVLRSLLLTHEGDLYNFERYRADSEALARLGYAVAFIPGQPAEGSDYPRGAYLLQSLTPRTPTSKSAHKTNYIGGTASYGPRAKGAAGLLYEKDELFGHFDRVSVSPTYNFAAGGSLSYDAPLLALREAPSRLYDLELSVFSDFTHDRQLGDVQTDQRQTGFSATVGIRPLHLEPPHALRLEVGLKSERIALDQVPAGEEEGATDSLEVGATYEWRHTYRRPSLTARLAPRIDFSLRSRGGERTFVRPGVDAILHARYPSGIEAHLHLVGGTIDRAVPSFEQWSLGGPNTVRGFREDSFLGRHLAALQTELWFPFVRQGPIAPPPMGQDWDRRNAPFKPPAARLFKWALFADGGYLSNTTVGRTAEIAGVGIGLRFLVPHHPFVVKVDYGRGLGKDGGHAFPYVSLAYRY
jgi:surface antigen Omp85-like protein